MHDHGNVLELRPRLTLDVDVVVDVHVDVIGFFIWLRLRRPWLSGIHTTLPDPSTGDAE